MTDIRPGFTDVFYRVIEPFEIYARRGIADSNTYFGASRVLGSLYEWVTVQVGSEIHALASGVFLIDPQGRLDGEVVLSPDEKHPIEKRYIPRREEWPSDKLERITSSARQVDYAGARNMEVLLSQDLREMGATRFGNGIDWVINA